MTRIILKKTSVDVCQSVRFYRARRIEERNELMGVQQGKSGFTLSDVIQMLQASRQNRRQNSPPQSDVLVSKFIGPTRVAANEPVLIDCRSNSDDARPHRGI
jgi:hypothetical protein